MKLTHCKHYLDSDVDLMLHNLSINIQCIKCINLLAVVSCFLACSNLECNLFVIPHGSVFSLGSILWLLAFRNMRSEILRNKLNNVFHFCEPVLHQSPINPISCIEFRQE